MLGVAPTVRAVLLAALASSCGRYSAQPETTHSDTGSPGVSGSASGGTGSTRSTGATTQGGGSTQDGGSTPGGAATQSSTAFERCSGADGGLSYGPIGEPWPLPLSAVSAGSCPNCSVVRDVFGFRTDGGYGFVWSFFTDVAAPGPNLFSVALGPSFQAEEPRALSTETAAYELDVVPGPDGLVAATCSWEDELELRLLNDELDVDGEATLFAPDAPCDRVAPAVLWTGERYLTAFTDSRGVVVVSLDAQGAVLGEEILIASLPNGRRAKTHLSQSGDRVLVATLGQYGVLDLQGRLVGEFQAITEESYIGFAVAAGRDGWLVVRGAEPSRTLRATPISRAGLAGPEVESLGWGYFSFEGFAPSAYGGYLLVGTLDEGGQFGEQYKVLALLDDAGDVAFSKLRSENDVEGWPLALIHDSRRDLVVGRRVDGSGVIEVVQEYGCAD